MKRHNHSDPTGSSLAGCLLLIIGLALVLTLTGCNLDFITGAPGARCTWTPTNVADTLVTPAGDTLVARVEICE